MRISYSALNTYQTCPLKYKFQNVDKIKEPKSKEAVFGTIIHAVMNFIHTPGILSPTLEQALDYFSKNWNSGVFNSEIEEPVEYFLEEVNQTEVDCERGLNYRIICRFTIKS